MGDLRSASMARAVARTNVVLQMRGGGMRKNEFVELLSTVWLFSRCTKRELHALASLATQLDVPAGKVLAT